MFAHSDLSTTGPHLAHALQTEWAVAISNGPFKDRQGMVAWVFYTKSNPTQAIASRIIMAPGTSNTQGYYHSKLLRIYGITMSIAVVYNYYLLHQSVV